ncbi:MAG: VanZ family protein [Ginsengibacter sp.]
MKKRIGFINFLPGIAWFFVIIFLTCLPGKDLPKIGWLEDIFFDKWVHIGLFGLLTFLFSYPIFKTEWTVKSKLSYFLLITILSSFWGLGIEFIQEYYVPGRSFDLLDWAADTVGALIAFWICSLQLRKQKTAVKV